MKSIVFVTLVPAILSVIVTRKSYLPGANVLSATSVIDAELHLRIRRLGLGGAS
jgi:hypothetical protein